MPSVNMDLETLEAAVACALNPHVESATKAQATNYCDQVKCSPDGWRLCLELATKVPKSSEQSRFFALQVLEETIRNKFNTLDVGQQNTIRQGTWKYFTSGAFASDPAYLRNKLALVIVLLFKYLYPESWPTFFEDLLTSLSTPSVELSPTFIDFFLRICLAIDEEVVCLYIPRSPEDTARNTHIKDVMRMGAVVKLADVWVNILVRNMSNMGLLNDCLKVIGLYVSWIDINLIVTPQFIPLLFQLIELNATKQAACDCLADIVGKGMKPAEKVELVRFLGAVDVLDRLSSAGIGTDDTAIELREHIAKLVNVIGLQLVTCWEDATAAPEVREAAYTFIHKVFPHFLKFLADEYDDVSHNTFPFLSAYVALLKRQSKTESGSATKSSVPQHLQSNFLALLRVLVVKMKFDPEHDGLYGANGEEEEAEFIEMRKNLKTHFDALAIMDEGLFSTFVPSAVCATFDSVATAVSKGIPMRNAVPWVDAELALHLLYIYGESCKGVHQFTRDNMPHEPTPLGQMIISMMKSNISAYPHVSISPIFFENVVRYTTFFEMHNQFLPDVLAAFVDERGLHHPNESVRNRIYYLFLRFTKSVKSKLVPYLDNLLVSIQDLLHITRPLQRPGRTKSDDVLSRGSTFDSQLYIFEAVGVLISMEGVTELKQVEYLTAVLNPIMSSIQEVMEKELYKHDQPPEDLPYTTFLHNSISAIGAISKGFPDVDSVSKTKLPSWSGIFKNSLLCVMAVLERLSPSSMIRSSARFTFQRMVSSMGTEILPYIQPLINAGLLSAASIKELVDFIPFVCLVIHRFKPVVFQVLDGLYKPLIERIFNLLNQPACGTDDAIALNELKKAYLSFLLAMLNADLERVFVSEENAPIFNTILQSVLHYAQDTSDGHSQKCALNTIARMIIVWGGGVDVNIQKPSKELKAKKNGVKAPLSTPVTSTTSSTPSSATPSRQYAPLPGFDQFLYTNIIPLLFELPRKVNARDPALLMVMGEIAMIHRIIYGGRGEEYCDFLLKVYFPSIQCPPEAAVLFVEGLRTLDGRGFKKHLQEFFK